MPFFRNRNILLIIFAVFVFCVCFSEELESKNKDLNDISSESTSVLLSPEEFISKIKVAYQNNCISGTRIMMESGEAAKYRYEYIIRNGHNKIVSLKMPYRVTWYRQNNKGYIIIDGKRTVMEDIMKDLEDVFLEDLEKELAEIKISEILYSGIPAYYVSVYGEGFTYRVIVLQKSMNFIRLEKQTQGKLTIIFYDNLNAGDKQAFENQMTWYEEIPLGNTFKIEPASTGTADEADSGTSVTNTTKEIHTKQFEEIVGALNEKYAVQKTEIMEFSDADAMFITLVADESEDPFVVSIVIYKSNPSQMSENLFGKVPENYNHFQKIKGNVEVNVIGVHDDEFLKSVAEMILID